MPRLPSRPAPRSRRWARRCGWHRTTCARRSTWPTSWLSPPEVRWSTAGWSPPAARTAEGVFRDAGKRCLTNRLVRQIVYSMVRRRSQATQSAASPRARKVTKAVSALQQTPAAGRLSADAGAVTGASEVWQARIGRDLAEQLRADAEVLGLDGRTDIVKAALGLLHRQAAEERVGRSGGGFYGASAPPLPLGVDPADDGA